MSFSDRLDRLHYDIRRHRWLRWFTVFVRVALAAGFIPSGMVKILGQRFTDLAVNHPMGHFLDAFFQTGYYYTFVGVFQVLAAVLLLIPRTALLGAMIYVPIILNILVLSFAVRFQGSLLTAPLMLLGGIYLICWDYHRVRRLFPWNDGEARSVLPPKEEWTYRFPWKFLGAVGLTIVTVVAGVFFTMTNALMPMNKLEHCRKRCEKTENPATCMDFCDCVHTDGLSLGDCLDAHYSAGLSE